MNGGRRIIPIDGVDADAGEANGFEAQAAEPLASGREREPEADHAAFHPEEPTVSDWEPAHLRSSVSDRVAVALAALAIAGWSGFFVWAVLVRQNAAITPDQWVWWMAQWSVPVLLVLVVYMLAMRMSRREASRFADVAQVLARETRQLEGRLAAMNTELSLARDFIAAQGRDLEALGRVAVERLSSSAGRLDELVGRNGMQIDRIADVSSAALDNMEKLRGQLPVIANAAKDVTNNIGNAGRTAHLQLEELVSGFQRLNEFGLASERQVASVRERIEAAVLDFSRASEDLSGLAEGRFEALASMTVAQQGLIRETEQAALAEWDARSDAHVAALRNTLARLAADHQAFLQQSAGELGRFEETARALTARLGEDGRALDDELARRRASTEADAATLRAALQDRLAEIDAAIAERRTAMEQTAASAVESLAAKLADLDVAISEQRRQQAVEADVMAARFDEIGLKIRDFTALLATSGEEGVEAAATIERAIGGLTGRLGEMRHALSGTDLEIGQLTDSAVRLLELIQAGGDHTRTQIPEALRSTEAGLKGLENRVFTLRDTLREAGDGGRSLANAVGNARGEIAATIRELHNAQTALNEQAAAGNTALGVLRETLGSATSESAALASDIEKRLSDAILQLAEAATQSGRNLREGALGEVEAIAAQLGERSNAAIARVLQGRAAELVGRLEEAIDSAAASSRETAIQMRDQLTKVDELAANLEARVSRAREKAEEQVENDFARRAALITESLNSSAIDIAKALSSDVSETAWASYLRGDRGIFTRRAVTLLEHAEAKAVQAHYEAESEFREHVNRYIHDFESMLRQLLSTRDGNALGVTLLSSDMGKLYVALAQGIERLRS